MGSVFHWFISNFVLIPPFFIYCSFVKRLAESPPTVLLFIKNVLPNIGPWYLSRHFRISLSVFIRMSIGVFTQTVFVYTKTCGEFDTFTMGTFLINKKSIFIYLSRKLSGFLTGILILVRILRIKHHIWFWLIQFPSICYTLGIEMMSFKRFYFAIYTWYVAIHFYLYSSFYLPTCLLFIFLFIPIIFLFSSIY